MWLLESEMKLGVVCIVIEGPRHPNFEKAIVSIKGHGTTHDDVLPIFISISSSHLSELSDEVKYIPMAQLFLE